jgi:hypothetical protein
VCPNFGHSSALVKALTKIFISATSSNAVATPTGFREATRICEAASTMAEKQRDAEVF